MARKKFTTIRSGSRRALSPPQPSFETAIGAEAPGCPRTTLKEAIEAERLRLMATDSVLACLEIALDPQASSTLPPPYLPSVLVFARELLNKSIRRLESTELGQLTHKTQR